MSWRTHLCLALLIFGLAIIPGTGMADDAKAADTGKSSGNPTGQAKERVEVKWGRKWWPATVLQRDGDRRLIKYDGWAESFNEWVMPDRVRPLKANPAAEGFAPQDEPAAGSKQEPSEAATENRSPAGDWSNVKQILPAVKPGSWSFKPDAAAKLDKPVTQQPILLKRDGARPAAAGRRRPGPDPYFFENAQELLFLPAPKAGAVIAYRNAPPGQPAGVRIELCNLASGKSQGWAPMPVDAIPIAMTGTGRRLCTRSEGGFGEKDRIDVWTQKGKKIELVKSWIPFDAEEGARRDVVWAAFVGEDHLLTVGNGGQLVLWNVDAARALYQVSLTGSVRPALSANEKYLAVITPKGLFFLDPLSGETLASLNGDSLVSGVLAFRPDGQRLACYGSQRVVVWDLAKGELYRDVALRTRSAAQKCDWVDDGYVLLDGQYLVDLERRTVLWEYRLATGTRAAGVFGGKYWYVVKDRVSNTSLLVPVSLPHDEALEVAKGLDPDEILAVRPGAKVSLEVNVGGEEQEKIFASLKSRLEKNGLEVVDGQDVKFVASTGPGETREIQYRMFGRFDNVKTSVTDQKSRLEVLVDGRVAWETVRVVSAPFFLRMKEGQTVEEVLAEAQKPDLGIFYSARIPTHITRPALHSAYGYSQLTANGILPAEPPQQQQP